MEYKSVSFEKLKADYGTPYLTMPSFIQSDNSVRAYEICNGDIIEYTLAEFLKPQNINMLMNNRFEVIGYSTKKDYWVKKIFGKPRIIHKPFTKVKVVRLMYIGE